ncbi:MAG: tRNA (adenosine(37)-N6)-threonylcarbamoyltransferase complex ATPase subunit type 1 TsaE [Oscillospiraceae bacterium]|nr:tRNA (adenosine(37)-N6)-threonylcarbamoyltransferase complex ATPase subunit type 1 TsaE [Oscillospiraceae bacterium]
MTYTTHSADETEQLAADFAKGLRGGDVLALFGGLGAGKTAFVRGLARGLGIMAAVSSPTYAIVHEYRAAKTAVCATTFANYCLAHFDMYRVSTWGDLESCGYFDYLESGAILAIEWSENIVSALPEGAIRVEILPGASDDERVICVT